MLICCISVSCHSKYLGFEQTILPSLFWKTIGFLMIVKTYVVTLKMFDAPAVRRFNTGTLPHFASWLGYSIRFSPLNSVLLTCDLFIVNAQHFFSFSGAWSRAQFVYQKLIKKKRNSSWNEAAHCSQWTWKLDSGR